MISVSFGVFGALAVAAGIVLEVLRQRVIVPAITEKSSYSVGISIFTLYAEAREYRDHCHRSGVPLRWWRLWWAAHVTFVLALVALAVTWALSTAGP